MSKHSLRLQRGVTLVELIAVLTIAGLGLGTSALYLAPAAAPLETGSVLVSSFLREARMKAMAHTSAYRVRPADPGLLTAETANSCSSETWKTGALRDLELPEGVSLANTEWSVCFSARGLSNDNVMIPLSHAESGQQQVEVMLGGATRVIH